MKNKKTKERKNKLIRLDLLPESVDDLSAIRASTGLNNTSIARQAVAIMRQIVEFRSRGYSMFLENPDIPEVVRVLVPISCSLSGERKSKLHKRTGAPLKFTLGENYKDAKGEVWGIIECYPPTGVFTAQNESGRHRRYEKDGEPVDIGSPLVARVK